MLTDFEKHQLRIARDTLRMNPVIVPVMGGMTIEEAEEIVRKYEDRKRTRHNEARRDRNEALKSCGLVRVKGSQGGTYWE